jgi:hypothetical protein
MAEASSMIMPGVDEWFSGASGFCSNFTQRRVLLKWQEKL